MNPRRRRLVVLHGVNLDMLGQRPAQQYGSVTLAELESVVGDECKRLGWECLCLQTNHEGVYVEFLHEHRGADALLVNPGAWTHYSYAIRDALEIVTCPVAEVHLSDIATREDWRRHSVISEVVSFTVAGKGAEGYVEAARRLVELAEGR
ncbi:MAG: 3-dehydroquinate dehydratase [Thermoleophilia bacterium]|nr:3-dehydroquinate dehydratase [Thermoleophilia bacterium]